ncbi:MAG: energy-coupling factor ABC transporter permease [Chloroflexi bacterium]|nr:energy-coupling factor ABC transporter permease [Chloroflexota bacterium]
MHIPDGFVNAGTAAVTYIASAGAVAYAVKRTNKALREREVPLMGVMAAFIFAAQMINFKVAGGTSGHLLGGALAAILLGPWAGTLVITAVLAVQAFVFQDGGLVALGANVLNMAVIGVWSAYGLYVLIRRAFSGERAVWIGGAVSAWASVVLAALAASIELAVSGMAPLGVVVTAMGLVHMAIGIGEALITVAVLGFLAATRKDLLELNALAVGGAS